MKHCVNRSRERKCNGILPAVKNHKIKKICDRIRDLGSRKVSCEFWGGILRIILGTEMRENFETGNIEDIRRREETFEEKGKWCCFYHGQVCDRIQVIKVGRSGDIAKLSLAELRNRRVG